MHFLIQGLFFQRHQWLGLGIDKTGDSCTLLNGGLCRFMYSGEIYLDPQGLMGNLIGFMQDQFGEARLYDVFIYPDQEFRFTKEYIGKKWPPIQYVFSKKEGISWVGTYTSPTAGDGITRCVLVEVDDGFFKPDSAMQLLGISHAHKWPDDMLMIPGL